MVLCIDVGNTTILFGVYDNDQLIDTYRMETKILKTSDEYGSSLLAHFQINDINVDMLVVENQTMMEQCIKKYGDKITISPLNNSLIRSINKK